MKKPTAKKMKKKSSKKMKAGGAGGGGGGSRSLGNYTVNLGSNSISYPNQSGGTTTVGPSGSGRGVSTVGGRR